MDKLPFVEVLGNSWTYNTITTRSSSAFRDVGDTWVESTPVLTQATAVLRILGGDADVDNFILTTRSNQMDVKGEVLEDKIKSVRETFLDCFWYGINSSNPRQFDGLETLMTSTTYNTVHQGSSSTGVLLSIVKLQSAIDLITGYEPQGMYMTKMMRRYINVYLDSIGDKFTTTRDQYGKMIEYFRGIPLYVDDTMSNAETISSSAFAASTGGECTTIFILNYSPKSCCGIQAGGGRSNYSYWRPRN